jgi:hypothetical protein
MEPGLASQLSKIIKKEFLECAIELTDVHNVWSRSRLANSWTCAYIPTIISAMIVSLFDEEDNRRC